MERKFEVSHEAFVRQQGIARRLIDVLNTTDPEITIDKDRIFFEDSCKNQVDLQLVSARDQIGLKPPAWFRLPTFLVSESIPTAREASEDRNTSPYTQDRLPRIVIGGDNRLYKLFNSYLIGVTGQIIKWEEIWDVQGDSDSLEERLSDVTHELEVEDIRRVDFIPNEEDSRFVTLDDIDLQTLEGIVEKMETGELKLYGSQTLNQ